MRKEDLAPAMLRETEERVRVELLGQRDIQRDALSGSEPEGKIRVSSDAYAGRDTLALRQGSTKLAE
jgi:hypothetical protein